MITLPIEIEEVDTLKAIECGLRQEWISTETEGLKIQMDSGAGLGSPWLQITIKKEEESRYFRLDMREFLTKFVHKVLNEETANAHPQK